MDPPIPVPDVAGADASIGGLPRRVDLTWEQKLIVDSSALADVGLRRRQRLTARTRLLAAAIGPASGSSGGTGLPTSAR